jgi:hypothetical protein
VFFICQLGLGLNEVTSSEEVLFSLRFEGNKVRQDSLADVQLQATIALSDEA